MSRRVVAFLAGLTMVSVQQTADAQESPRDAKACLFYAADRLPRISGLTIKNSKVAFKGSEPSLLAGMEIQTYIGELEVNALGQNATYEFRCPVLVHKPGALRTRIDGDSFIISLTK